MLPNIALATDSYKLTHFRQYPEGTEAVYSYFESRKGAQFDFTVFFGLQMLMDEYFNTVPRVLSAEDVNQARTFVGAHLGNPELFNYDGWMYIVEELGGNLPLRIKAVPEGTVVPVGNVLMTVENTDPNCYWLTNYVETLLTHVWYPSTVATLSKWVKNGMEARLGATGDPGAVNFMLHDFGFRGVSSYQSAELGGAAHLVNFMGTDTIAGMIAATRHYSAMLDNLAFSVPATEHSIMTALGEDGEIAQLERALEAYPTGIVSVVADSYDIYRFTEEVIKRRDQILMRDGRFVLRPDSITNTHRSPSELSLALMNMLWDGFGGHVNSKGYKVLDDHVRMLWGDGIDHHGIMTILDVLIKNGYAADNMVFGMGGGLLQKVNRDTQRFAFKSSAQKRNGEWFDVYKQPLDATKASKKGRLKLIREGGTYVTVNEDDPGEDQLVTVYEDGGITKRWSFDEIRARAND